VAGSPPVEQASSAPWIGPSAGADDGGFAVQSGSDFLLIVFGLPSVFSWHVGVRLLPGSWACASMSSPQESTMGMDAFGAHFAYQLTHRRDVRVVGPRN
jgi:hypothetical protein